jgi:hypothetical protein
MPRRVTNGRTAASAELPDPEERAAFLLAAREPTHYTVDEQRFSALLQRSLDELLRGERNSLLLLRKYPNEPGRLGIMATPPDVDPRGLRITIVERMISSALLFLHADPHGGPTSQHADGDGLLVESQKFTTKFPHIVIERVDVYDARTEQPVRIQWCARRVQNQRAATRINRMLDAANLGVDVVKLFL